MNKLKESQEYEYSPDLETPFLSERLGKFAQNEVTIEDLKNHPRNEFSRELLNECLNLKNTNNNIDQNEIIRKLQLEIEELNQYIALCEKRIIDLRIKEDSTRHIEQILKGKDEEIKNLNQKIKILHDEKAEINEKCSKRIGEMAIEISRLKFKSTIPVDKNEKYEKGEISILNKDFNSTPIDNKSEVFNNRLEKYLKNQSQLNGIQKNGIEIPQRPISNINESFQFQGSEISIKNEISNNKSKQIIKSEYERRSSLEATNKGINKKNKKSIIKHHHCNKSLEFPVASIIKNNLSKDIHQVSKEQKLNPLSQLEIAESRIKKLEKEKNSLLDYIEENLKSNELNSQHIRNMELIDIVSKQEFNIQQLSKQKQDFEAEIKELNSKLCEISNINFSKNEGEPKELSKLKDELQHKDNYIKELKVNLEATIEKMEIGKKEFKKLEDLYNLNLLKLKQKEEEFKKIQINTNLNKEKGIHKSFLNINEFEEKRLSRDLNYNKDNAQNLPNDIRVSPDKNIGNEKFDVSNDGNIGELKSLYTEIAEVRNELQNLKTELIMSKELQIKEVEEKRSLQNKIFEIEERESKGKTEIQLLLNEKEQLEAVIIDLQSKLSASQDQIRKIQDLSAYCLKETTTQKNPKNLENKLKLNENFNSPLTISKNRINELEETIKLDKEELLILEIEKNQAIEIGEKFKDNCETMNELLRERESENLHLVDLNKEFENKLSKLNIELSNMNKINENNNSYSIAFARKLKKARGKISLLSNLFIQWVSQLKETISKIKSMNFNFNLIDPSFQNLNLNLIETYSISSKEINIEKCKKVSKDLLKEISSKFSFLNKAIQLFVDKINQKLNEENCLIEEKKSLNMKLNNAESEIMSRKKENNLLKEKETFLNNEINFLKEEKINLQKEKELCLKRELQLSEDRNTIIKENEQLKIEITSNKKIENHNPNLIGSKNSDIIIRNKSIISINEKIFNKFSSQINDYFTNIERIFLNNLYLEDSRHILEKILKLFKNNIILQIENIKFNFINKLTCLNEFKVDNVNLSQSFEIESQNYQLKVEEEIHKNGKMLKSLEDELEEVKFKNIKEKEDEIEKFNLINIEINSLRNENHILKSKISRFMKQRKSKLFINHGKKNKNLGHINLNLNENENEKEKEKNNDDLIENIIPSSTRYISNASSLLSYRHFEEEATELKKDKRSTLPVQMMSPINFLLGSESKSIKSSHY